MLKKLFFYLLLLILVATTGSAGFAWMRYEAFLQQQAPQNLDFVVARGWSVGKTAQQLEARGVIDSALFFRLMNRHKPGAALKAGTFAIEKGMTPEQILLRLRSTDVVRYMVTFPEGISLKQIAQRFNEKGWSGAGSALLTPQGRERLGVPQQTLEGLLFPDTYYYEANEQGWGIAQRMVQRMQQVLDKAWGATPKEQKKLSRYETLILASIVEKETGAAAERPEIAGVFHNRLARRMRLQSDPTVIYGIKDYRGNITRKHLRTPTPYNTYTISALPPTPICSPGAGAITAVLHPKKTNALYFVARGDGSGSHRFARTLKEHNRNVKTYLKQLRKNRK
ncbi:endolytic transglycosylase MltG [Magnetococcus sp. PR-3]|uniref:endolytic transglycosylase MltG n=1 Tax=Magnetococcus sp. PR-3 TaxID=3120355 RepID=UPI002FCE0AD7